MQRLLSFAGCRFTLNMRRTHPSPGEDRTGLKMKIGIDPDEVRRLTAAWRRPDDEAQDDDERPEDSEPNYRCGDEWRETVQTLRKNELTIFGLALKGFTCDEIAACFNVSRECIAKRLRPAGFLNRPGIRGRPRKTPTTPKDAT